MRKLSVLIVDDEIIMCSALQHQLAKFPYLEVVGDCHDGYAALLAVEKLKPDIVFLDIHMPGLTGIEVAAALDQLETSPEVVFVTAYDDYALKAYEVGAVDYVLKPFDTKDIIRVLRKIRRLRALQAHPLISAEIKDHDPKLRPTKFCLYSGEKMEIVDVSTIKLFEVEQGKVYAHTVQETKHSVRQTLQEMEQLLDHRQFFRCHRNYIVNINFIKSVSPWFNRGLLLSLKGEKSIEIPVSRAQTKKLEQYINF